MRPWFVETARIVSNRAVDASMNHLVVSAPSIAETASAGQFVVFRTPADATLLPRPFDLHGADPDAGTVEVVFRVKGRGTRALAAARAGDALAVQGPFGRPAEPLLRGRARIAVVGRGAGISPLAFLAARARALGVEVDAYLSARTPALLQPFESLHDIARVTVQTDLDRPGEVVTDRMAEALQQRSVDAAFVVGSRRLAAGTLALARRDGFTAYTYAECHMGCGFGHCKSCAVPMRSGGYLLACLEGPVVDLGEVSDAYWHVLPA
ncbi:MAG TPA: FAD-binding oxidoreductase [Trueperaceae bacterium]|nr:FAD-binding oxidoreductase [Trueperaceae bacterium]